MKSQKSYHPTELPENIITVLKDNSYQDYDSVQLKTSYKNYPKDTWGRLLKKLHSNIFLIEFYNKDISVGIDILSTDYFKEKQKYLSQQK